jgi:DNA invertase Pin-like site-specific DNA recombinase
MCCREGSRIGPGLQAALRDLQRGVDVLVVLKFDRLSRSIKHFCELYETYFQSGEKELVAIRESIRLDSSLGRALVSILLVFAQMERGSDCGADPRSAAAYEGVRILPWEGSLRIHEGASE